METLALIQMYRNQTIGRVARLTTVAGNSVEPVLGSGSVAAVGKSPSSEIAVGHADTTCTPVAVILTIPAGPGGQTTGSSHVPEGGVQKGVLRFTALIIIIDTTHCIVALDRTSTYMLNCKPLGPGAGLSRSTKWVHWPP